jgi:catechol 2,3-dioxygenase-like lactoylglutathione lyase family enzyme
VADDAPFLSLDFLYVPTPDVDAAARWYVDVLHARLEWKVRAMGTTVAAVRVADVGPLVLLAGHLQGGTPVLVYRVADYAATVAGLEARGVAPVEQLEIPHGPCASFRAEGGQRLAVYELVRPEAVTHFPGRIDP